MNTIKEFISRYKVSLTILVSFLIVAFVGTGIYIWHVKNSVPKKELSPAMKTLLQLSKSSRPATATPEERTQLLDNLQKGSTPVATTTMNNQLDVLDQLQGKK